MSRPLRLEFAGALYHVIARDIFRDDGDRATFLDVLGREIAQQRWRLYAYCLMGNHYHLLIETPEPNLTRGMQRLNQVYTQRSAMSHFGPRCSAVSEPSVVPMCPARSASPPARTACRSCQAI
jgi:REP element-mobilizing transposase RayT